LPGETPPGSVEVSDPVGPVVSELVPVAVSVASLVVVVGPVDVTAEVDDVPVLEATSEVVGLTEVVGFGFTPVELVEPGLTELVAGATGAPVVEVPGWVPPVAPVAPLAPVLPTGPVVPPVVPGATTPELMAVDDELGAGPVAPLSLAHACAPNTSARAAKGSCSRIPMPAFGRLCAAVLFTLFRSRFGWATVAKLQLHTYHACSKGDGRAGGCELSVSPAARARSLLTQSSVQTLPRWRHLRFRQVASRTPLSKTGHRRKVRKRLRGVLDSRSAAVHFLQFR
jgi:hypothetical protein